MFTLSLIGLGAIGTSVLERLSADASVRVDRVLVRPGTEAVAQARLDTLAPGARAVAQLEPGDRPDLLVECAGHPALRAHVMPALARGIPCLVVSVGALAEPGLAEELELAARAGNTQLQLLPGAIGAVDALAAARIGGLDDVVYTGSKPALAWRDTPASERIDLAALSEPTTIFDGTAADAARLYPKNANVAATLSMAGLGLDRTRVRLVADPAGTENIHHVQASGAFGSFELTMRGKPLAANPKTSALTVYSVLRAIGNRVHPVAV